jgi:hypothetical protein
MLACAKPEPDFARGCASRKIGHSLFTPHPLVPPLANGSLLASWRDPAGSAFYCFLDSRSQETQKGAPDYIDNYATYETCGQ